MGGCGCPRRSLLECSCRPHIFGPTIDHVVVLALIATKTVEIEDEINISI